LISAAALISVAFVCVAALLVRLNTKQWRVEAKLLHQADELRASRQEAELANAAAHAADRAKSEFLANMSHELRTPLNAIIGFSEMMSLASVGPLSAQYRGYAKDIHGAGDHLPKLLNEILDLSKVEAGRLELHEEEIALDELFDGCRRLMAERAAAGGLTLEFQSNDLKLSADPLRLKQMMLNLLSNAIKFTPPDGRVTATADLTTSDGLAISVRDTGIGIKAEDIPRALEPFGQVDNAATRSLQGTGLGLPLARRLVELHDGELLLESRPGQGTTVTLIFPAARTLCSDRKAIAMSQKRLS
jgi:signal transduction histidine kinase